MKTLLLTLSLAVLLCACGGGTGAVAADDDGGNPPPAGAPTDFTEFVKQLFAQTDDTSDPVDINGLDFDTFSFDDEDAFDDLLP